MVDAESLDRPFAAGFVHRIRFASGVFEAGGPRGVFAGLMGDGAGRALVCIDGGLAEARPGLAEAVALRIRDELGGGSAGPVVVVVAGGEGIKNDAGRVDDLLAAIHGAGLCRHSFVVAIGGGAVLDAVGYAAAIAHRGIRLIRVPTTTMGQADSCVAVKCGINAFGKKNYLGVFAPPWGVVIDPTLLASLSLRDWRAGFSEAVKVGLIKDAGLFRTIAGSAERIEAREMAAAWPVIRRSADLHLRHITDGGDPFEQAEARPLDFGHWAAHRLEAMTGHRLRHGEAVAIGLAIDAEYSERVGLAAKGVAGEVRGVLVRLGFELWDSAMEDAAGLLAGLDEFREHLGGRLTLAMLAVIGRGVDVNSIDRWAMLDAIGALRPAAGRGREEAA